MPIIKCHTLNSAQKAQIHSLEDRCLKGSSLTLSFPEDSAEYFLLYSDENGSLLSAAAFTPVQDGIFECSAFTDPAFRNQGLFSDLLEAGLSMLPGESDLIFYCDGRCPDTLKVLEALEAEYLTCDYMMELSPELLVNSLHEILTDSSAPVTPAFESLDEDGCPLLLFRSPYGEALVSCQKTCYYFYSFEIKEGFRGIGHGQSLLFQILKALYRKCPGSVRLQVSGDNFPALSLYKKTGFRITDTLSTYLY